MAKQKLVMTGGRRYRPVSGNIDANRTEFMDTWPNGRPFKHGAMKVHFIFRPASRISAEADIESFMEDHGYERGVHYHIPAWNYPNQYPREEFWDDKLTITFNNDETFVMAKLGWDMSATVIDDES